MTNQQILQWIKSNLGTVIKQSIAAALIKNPQLLYTEDWLAAIACRESGGVIAKHAPALPEMPSGRVLSVLAPLMRGDYGQRPHDAAPKYHGYGFWQADIDSFPDFVRSGAWQDPTKACAMAISILEGKRLWLEHHIADFKGYPLDRCIIAAYNCGEGNVEKVIAEGHDIDIRTTDKNYSAQVWEFRTIYQSL